MNKNIKVGFTTIIFFTLVITLIFGYKYYTHKITHYDLTLILSKAEGLDKNSEIRYLGVVIGKVLKVDTNDNSAIALIEINKKSKIPIESEFTIDRIGLFSDKIISIYPSDKREYYKPNDTITNIKVDSIATINNFTNAANAIVGVKNMMLQAEMNTKLDTILTLIKEIKENQKK